MKNIKDKMEKISPVKWRIPKSVREKMRVDGIAYGNEYVMKQVEDGALEQLTNVACLPGAVEPAIAAPDIHFGYGLPMGAVGAFDEKEGIIGAGLTGFDINCLDGNTEILHEFGYRRKIKDFEKSFHKEKIKCVNPHKELRDTKIDLFLKSKGKRIFQVFTKSGRKIIATDDHPFLTEEGMIKLQDLDGQKISIFPFEGVKYEKPSDAVIISEDMVKKRHRKELKKKGLLPLRYSSKKLPLVLKIIGFALGDGTISERRVCFYEDPENLDLIKKDIKRLGFDSHKYSRERDHEIDTHYGEVKFKRTEHSLTFNSKHFSSLLKALKIPFGNKTKKKFLLPQWLFECTKWQKRLFLASFFGAELSSPKTVTDHGYNFYGPVLSMNKDEKMVENCKEFLKQIKSLLDEFGIKSRIIKPRKEYVNKKGEISYRLRLQISSDPQNLIKLWGLIGFEYSVEKRFLANVGVQYLRLKARVLKKRKKSQERALELWNKGCSFKEIRKKLESKYVNERFLKRTIYEHKREPRIAFNFPVFEKYIKKATKGLGKTGQVWDRILSKEEIDDNGTVYDFTVRDEHHNFIANNFVVSNCGIRMITTNLTKEDIGGKLRILIDRLFKNVPSGVGAKSRLKLKREELEEVLEKGAKWAVENGYATEEDLERMEENGCMEGADTSKVSDKAKKRGLPQLGTLGSGNHFLEVQFVDEIYDKETAKKFGIEKEGQVVVMIHCGSRGFGHQVASDYLKIHGKAADKYDIWLPDKQLVCAPADSKEGQDYYKAMKCAVNYAFVNRTVIMKWVRDTFEEVFDKSWKEMNMKLIYDVCHNICKKEEHEVDGEKKNLYVHRKGATRALPPGHPLVPDVYKDVGHPVLIAGSMGTASYVLVGTEKSKESYYSTCHGAGRVMSRKGAIRKFYGETVKKNLYDKQKIYVRATHGKVIAEEAPGAYKDVDQVIESVHEAGISKKVAKVRPMGVAKG